MFLIRNRFVNNQPKRTAVAVTFVWIAATPALAVPESVPIEQQVKDVVSHLEGVMDTSAQAAANPGAPNVRMTTCKVTVEKTNALPNSQPSVFLYQEQALSQKLGSPYRQRLLQIAPSADGKTVESRAFRPPTPEKLIGLCNKPEHLRVIRQSDLGQVTCSIFLKPVGNNYVGETPAEGCPSSYKGAVRITNTITLHETGMDTQDRGFDAFGHQVWGTLEQSYEFRWVERNGVTRE
ncbi:MAG: chromophore lyase CpcT/CpeT [Coleofasciculaceae cyanobacterium]